MFLFSPRTIATVEFLEHYHLENKTLIVAKNLHKIKTRTTQNFMIRLTICEIALKQKTKLIVNVK